LYGGDHDRARRRVRCSYSRVCPSVPDKRGRVARAYGKVYGRHKAFGEDNMEIRDIILGLAFIFSIASFILTFANAPLRTDAAREKL